MTERRQTCTDHCGGCGGHFHGLTAFEAHRRDLQCVNPETARSEKGRQLLQPWTVAGWCDLSPGYYRDAERLRYEHPVTVWQRADQDGRFSLPSNAQEPTEAETRPPALFDAPYAGATAQENPDVQ